MLMKTRVGQARWSRDRLLASLAMAGLVVLWGCTEPNPDALGDGTGGGVRDLAQQPGAEDLSGPPQPADLTIPHGGRDMSRPEQDASSCPPQDPPPPACGLQEPGGFAIQALVQVDRYDGVVGTLSGKFEDFDGTILCTSFVSKPAGVDTLNVHVGMKLAGAIDHSGLPQEIPLSPGQVIEVEGEYIPASGSNATNDNGPAALITYTHAPCGFVVIDGVTYLHRRPHR